MADEVPAVSAETTQAASGEGQAPNTTPEAAEAAAVTDQTAAAEAEGEGNEAGNDAPGESDAETSEQRRNNVPARERIKQLTDKGRAKDATIAHLQQQISHLQQQTKQLGDPLEYASDAEYMQAVADNAARQATVAALQAQQQAAVQERHNAAIETWAERCDQVRATVPDFDAVAFNPSLSVPQHVTTLLLNVENGPNVAYFLGKNPAEAARIARLQPTEAALAIGGLSQRLAAPPVKRTPLAPKPPVTLNGAGNTPSVDPGNLSMKDYRAWRAKKTA